jgi:hypothetical protein
MRKLIAFTMLCVFSLLLKNEKAISKSTCKTLVKSTISHCRLSNPEAGTESLSGSLQPYDGFFKKL